METFTSPLNRFLLAPPPHTTPYYRTNPHHTTTSHPFQAYNSKEILEKVPLFAECETGKVEQALLAQLLASLVNHHYFKDEVPVCLFLCAQACERTRRVRGRAVCVRARPKTEDCAEAFVINPLSSTLL